MQIVSSFAERFKEVFGDRSVTEFANQIGVSKQTVSAWLNGVRKPKQPTIAILSSYFNVSPAWLIGYDCGIEPLKQPTFNDLITEDNVDFQLTDEEREIIEKYRQFNYEGKEKIKSYIDDLSENSKLKKCNEDTSIKKQA